MKSVVLAENPTDGSEWMVQVLSTPRAIRKFARLRVKVDVTGHVHSQARKLLRTRVCRKDLNHPHTAVCGILVYATTNCR